MDNLTIEEVARQNEMLEQSGRQLFNGRATLRIVDPGKVRYRDENARFFKRDMFRQLVQNIRDDARLSSVPLCYTNEEGELEVLSGNHRMKASVEAGIPWVLVMVLLEDLSHGKLVAIQLSHNALVGEDDTAVLASLWNQIDDIQDRLYAGLTSDSVGEMPEIQLVSFSTPGVATKTVMFAFTPHEMEVLDKVMEELGEVPANRTYLAPVEAYQAFSERLLAMKRKEDIKDGSLAMLRMIDILQENMGGGQ